MNKYDNNISDKYSSQINVGKQQTYNDQIRKLGLTIDENFNALTGHFGNGIDLVRNKYDMSNSDIQFGVAFINCVSNKDLISRQIIEPLLSANPELVNASADILGVLSSKIIPIPNVYKIDTLNQAIENLLNGNTILFFNNYEEALVINTTKLEKRSIEKPGNEATILGSQDSFIEDLPTNLSMVIRRLPTMSLRVETFTVGMLSHTEVKLIWLEGICNSTALQEVRKRLLSVDIDIVDSLGILAELIEDKPVSIFPKYRITQRADVIARNICNGKFALLCDNVPTGLLAPVSLWDNLRTMDDYAEKSSSSSYLRIIRLIALILSTTVSSLYLAFVTYNHSIVPPSLAVNITAGREGVPFPTIVELLLMTIAVSVLSEASLRIPGTAGYFIGALAAVVVGQSIVTAGYVSASVIIVVVVSMISSFATGTTSLLYQTRLLNYFMIFCASIFGMFGIFIGISIIIWHLLTLQSFGMPYLYPLVPFDPSALKDTFIRAPLKTMKERYKILSNKNNVRLSSKGIKRK